jgi:hypothetical protein
MKKLATILLLSLATFGFGQQLNTAQNIGPNVNGGLVSIQQALGPFFTNPWCVATPNSLTLPCYGGQINIGNGPVTVNPQSVTLTANQTSCARPAMTACDFVYVNSTGTISFSTSFLTATANGNSLLGYAQTNATGVTWFQGAYQDSFGVSVNSQLNDYYQFVPAVGPCIGTVSGNSSGTNGSTTVGGVAVVQDSTSVTGTNTHSYTCHMPLLSRTTSGKGIVSIVDVTFFYGVQTASLGTQAAVLASGTLNGTTVFTQITYPAAGAGETQSAAAARADSGTATWTPIVGSFNVGTTTAGQFFSEKLAPGSTLTYNTDLTDLTFNVTLQCTATTATISNTPGFIVHYQVTPF